MPKHGYDAHGMYTDDDHGPITADTDKAMTIAEMAAELQRTTKPSGESAWLENEPD